MLSTPRIRKILENIALLLVIPAVIGVLIVDIRMDDVRAFFLDRHITLAVWIYGVVLLVFLAFAIFLNNRSYQRDKAIERRDEDIHRLKQTISTLERHLDDAKQLRFLDVVTGIPNEAKWQVDIERLAAAASDDAPCHVALIDLVAFGKLNDELGYAKVDEILRYLAQTLDDNMRKNEGLYRKHLEDNALLPDRLYRKYPGGDEFYIVVEGSEAEMLGLLARLQQLMSKRIDQHVTDDIAGKPVKLKFSGAVCRLYRDERADSVTKRLIEGLRPTRYPNAARRLNWQSGRKSTDCRPDSLEHRLYKQAEEEFANP
jgi:diguanylate cyclase (GGDEF)-like protein